MKKGDVLFKKWCFGVGSYTKEWVEKRNGEAVTTYRFPRYRSIAMRVLKAKKTGATSWDLEVERYASLNGKPKKVEIQVELTKDGTYAVPGQQRVYHKVCPTAIQSEEMPPVGSLVTLNKRHVIVTNTGRNELTVWVDGQYHTYSVKPGTLRWREDKIIASLAAA